MCVILQGETLIPSSLHIAVTCAANMLKIHTRKDKRVVAGCSGWGGEVLVDLSPQPKVNDFWPANQLLERLTSPVRRAVEQKGRK